MVDARQCTRVRGPDLGILSPPIQVKCAGRAARARVVGFSLSSDLREAEREVVASALAKGTAHGIPYAAGIALLP